VEVIARVEFLPGRGGSKMTVLKVPGVKYIKLTEPDSDPWVTLD
jgi:hypothetical protein